MGDEAVGRALNVVTCLAAASAAGLVAGFVVFASSLARYEEAVLAPADGIVVLTGGEQRVREAIKLLAEGRARRLLISGVNRQTSREDLRRLTGLPAPLFDCCVDIGYTARDTIGNAEEAKSWVETWHFNKLLVVTSSYHMPRSLAEFARALPSVALVPHAVVPKNFHADQWWARAGTAKIVLIEYVKYVSSLTGLGTLRLLRPQDGGAIARNSDPRINLSKL
jgi:uncharacterized SAM-binding protein YcdF (DUF218 family)